MNIDDYRAMVKEEKETATKDSQTKEQPADAQTEPSKAEPILQSGEQEGSNQPTPTETGTKEAVPIVPEEVKSDAPTTITIEGFGEVPLDELQKGYLRQSDYTKKTQELAQHRREADQALEVYSQLQQDPEQAKQLSKQYNLPQLDPAHSRMRDMESKYHDLLLERDIEKLSTKYADFNETEVIQMAYDKNLGLEDAYQLVKLNKPVTPISEPPQVDIESIKEQLRQELRQELQLNQDTTSIIQPGGSAPKVADEPKLSAQEVKVASMMKMSPTEYAKWREKK